MNQNPNETALYTHQHVSSEKGEQTKPASVGDDVEVLEPSDIPAQNVKGFSTVKKSSACTRNVNIELPYDSTIPH